MFEDATLMIQEAKALTVSTVSGRQRATDLWDAIRAFRKQAEAQKETVCRPLKTAWDEAKVPFDTFVKECQSHEATLQKLMSAWDQKQEALARAEQAKIQAAIDAKNAKIIERAEAKGIEPILKVAPVVVAPPKSITTQAGTVQGRSEKTVHSISGIPTDATINAADPLAAELLAAFPALFQLDWVAFRKLAGLGMMKHCKTVTESIEYNYSQRK